MNKHKLTLLIEFLKNQPKYSLSMNYWQSNPSAYRKAKEDIESFHSCGNRACIAGYMALMPEFREDGGSVMTRFAAGAPKINELHGVDAVLHWLEADTANEKEILHLIISGEGLYDYYDIDEDPSYSDSENAVILDAIGWIQSITSGRWHLWDIEDAVAVLTALRDGELV